MELSFERCVNFVDDNGLQNVDFLDLYAVLFFFFFVEKNGVIKVGFKEKDVRNKYVTSA